MPRIRYIPRNFTPSSAQTIVHANAIIAQYRQQGFDLTLRQLYYQFVSRNLVPNRDSEYKKLGSIINDARLAGLIDWNSIEDRTRNIRGVSHWDSPSDIIAAAANSFRIDKWEKQANRIEVWIEKDALVGVISRVCEALDVPYFSCRGYVSQSEMWQASRRLIGYLEAGQQPVILHFGDHDPSGLDMTRDIRDRLNMFALHDFVEAYAETPEQYADMEDAYPIVVSRLALNMDQIRQYNPPPNPAKLTDARCFKYIDRYGPDSWELDALEPTVIADLIQRAVVALRDENQWNESVEEERVHRAHLAKTSLNWTNVAEYVTHLRDLRQ